MWFCCSVLLLLFCSELFVQGDVVTVKHLSERLAVLELRQSEFTEHVRHELSTLEASVEYLSVKDRECEENIATEKDQQPGLEDILQRLSAKYDHLSEAVSAVKANVEYLLAIDTEDIPGETGDKDLSNVPIDGSVPETLVSHVEDESPGSKQRRQLINGSGQAFTAYLSNDIFLGAGQAVEFDRVLLNEGGGYNVHTGAFTCYEAGLYLFMFFIGDNQVGAEMLTSLEVNRVHQVDVALEAHNSTHKMQGFNAVVTRLDLGDVVMVRSSSNIQAEGSSALRTTTFTGLFLRN